MIREGSRRKTRVHFSLGSHGEDAMRALPPEDVELKTLKVRDSVQRTDANLVGLESLLSGADYAGQESFFNTMSRGFLRQFQDPGSMGDIVKGVSDEFGLRIIYPERYSLEETNTLLSAIGHQQQLAGLSRWLFRSGRYDDAVQVRLQEIGLFAELEDFRSQRMVDMVSAVHRSDFMEGEDIRAVYRVGSIHMKAYVALKRISRDVGLSPDELKAKHPHLTQEQAESYARYVSGFEGIEVSRETDRRPYVFPSYVLLAVRRMMGRSLEGRNVEDAVARSFIEDFVQGSYAPHVDIERISPLMRDVSKGMGVADARRLSEVISVGGSFQQFLDENGIELPSLEEVRTNECVTARRR